jgi:hypothetical protein
MDIVLEIQKMYWTNFNEELYKKYLKAKIEIMQSADKNN